MCSNLYSSQKVETLLKKVIFPCHERPVWKKLITIAHTQLMTQTGKRIILFSWMGLNMYPLYWLAKSHSSMQNDSKSSFTILFPLQVLLREHSTSSFISQGLPLLFSLHHLHSGVQPSRRPGKIQIRFEFLKKTRLEWKCLICIFSI